MEQPVLFADIDGTLVLRSLEQWLLIFMRQEKLLDYSRIVLASLNHLLRNPCSKWHEWKLIYLQGRSEPEVEKWIETCWERYIQPALIPESIRLLNILKKQQVRIVLLSGTPKPLAVPLMSYLNLHEIICAEPVIECHRYGGGVHRRHPRGVVKVRYVEAWMAEHRQSWDNTIAMADHWKDRYLLSRVAVPVAVHPKPKLARLAEMKHWPMLVPDSKVETVTRQIFERIDLKSRIFSR